ncbi:divergent polysaccharide deacetylase family protein [Marinivivus vitaminiproducens]|uniref:divergent polysaccharide deacetylase family protein n=1 Tax=Marinivivus vitaminiproducens TaxID=3035935 RepID=UPI0027A6BD4E|nr:divergent polysaccharide deacetylase family protein [Geminicoccaceae bacterium SCSIO 64248]
MPLLLMGSMLVAAGLSTIGAERPAVAPEPAEVRAAAPEPVDMPQVARVAPPVDPATFDAVRMMASVPAARVPPPPFDLVRLMGTVPDAVLMGEEAVAALPSLSIGPSLHKPTPPRPPRPPIAAPKPGTWLAEAQRSARTLDRPAIAIVIDDLGLNVPGTNATIKLPPPITLAFLPYAQDLAAKTAAGAKAGHELMVHVPMEPLGSENPGPDALRVGLSDAELRARLERALGRFEGFVGINNHMGSRLTADAGAMGEVMRVLGPRGVFFVDSMTTSRSQGAPAAGRAGIPFAMRDVFLDDQDDAGAIRRQLVRLEQVAKRHGTAIAIGHPRPATLAALRDWLPGLQQRGYLLVPASTIVAKRFCGARPTPSVCDAQLVQVN